MVTIGNLPAQTVLVVTIDEAGRAGSVGLTREDAPGQWGFGVRTRRVGGVDA
jgi:hypothetical protein